jgi:2-polyprenyl-6-methoxyphenol hydroxylase-like FAD-dependent oxidoreductase
MYDNVQDKSHVLLGKKVVAVAQTKNGVMVRTEDGASFEGDIVIGADGINSVVRRDMWRIGNEISPGCFTGDELSRKSLCSGHDGFVTHALLAC